LILLDDVLKALQRCGPKLGQHVADRVEGVWVQCVQPAHAVPALIDQTCLGEHLEVMADSLLRRVEVGRDLTGGELAIPHQPEDLPAVRVGERSKDSLSGITLIG
jgi:hypothetical protein